MAHKKIKNFITQKELTKKQWVHRILANTITIMPAEMSKQLEHFSSEDSQVIYAEMKDIAKKLLKYRGASLL